MSRARIEPESHRCLSAWTTTSVKTTRSGSLRSRLNGLLAFQGRHLRRDGRAAAVRFIGDLSLAAFADLRPTSSCDRLRLTAVSRESLANDCGRRYLTLADLPDGCLVYLGTGPSLAAGPAAGSAPRRRCPANDCCRWRRTGPFDPQLPMTETAWASEMQRKAAGHLRAVSENQSHKIRCRSAVGRVGRQSTLSRHSMA